MRDFAALFSGPLRQLPDVSRPLLPRPVGLVRPCSMLSILSWNLLAPPYMRRQHDAESEAEWTSRAQLQIAQVAERRPDVIGLQEFWSENTAFVGMWTHWARSSGYCMHVLPRPNDKADGCAMLVRADVGEVEFEGYTFDDWGSRVCQVARLQLSGGRPLVLMQTHLTFPHRSAHDPPMRCEQARKLSELVRAQSAPTCVFGDFNGGEDDPAVGLLLTRGGLRPMPPPRAEPSAEAAGVSHVAHTGATMACDRLFTRGPVHVTEWAMGGSHAELLAGKMPSDHRPVVATIELGVDVGRL